VDGVLSDVVCVGRDYDFLEYRDGRWGFLLRQPIYERDWIHPVMPDASLSIDPAVLGRYPEGYAHLGYAQSLLGYEINANLPTHDNARVDDLYRAGRRWLDEGVIDWAI
jgi:hypothetical protein